MTLFSPANWQLIHEQSLTDVVTRISAPYSGNSLFVKASLLGAPETWTKAGEVFQIVDIPSIGEWTPNKRYELLWLNQLTLINPVKLDDYGGFKLKIERAKWVNPLTVQIYQSIDSMQIFVEPGQVVIPSADATASAATVVAAATTSTQLLAVNANRKYATIMNTSATADLFLDTDGAVSLVSYAYKIPRGGSNSIQIDNWKGVVHGIWSAANGAAEIRDYT